MVCVCVCPNANRKGGLCLLLFPQRTESKVSHEPFRCFSNHSPAIRGWKLPEAQTLTTAQRNPRTREPPQTQPCRLPEKAASAGARPMEVGSTSSLQRRRTDGRGSPQLLISGTKFREMPHPQPLFSSYWKPPMKVFKPLETNFIG